MKTSERILLVVDDDDDVREALGDIFRPAGWEVLEARDGVEALKLFRAQPVEAVLTDLRMPGMDGIQLLSRLREIDPEVPIVVLSAYGTIERCVEALRFGASDFIHKPFEDDALVASVEKAWGSRLRGKPAGPVLERSDCRLTVRLPADPGLVQEVIAEVDVLARNFGYFHRRWGIRRALEEALANAIRYGAGANPDQTITVEATFDGQRGFLAVSDPGAGFPGPRPGAVLPAEHKGLFLIRSYADEARWPAPGNRVEMVFHRAPKAP